MRARGSPLPQREKRSIFVLGEGTDAIRFSADQPCNLGGRAVSQPNPDYLGRRTEEHAEPMKVLVLRDERVPFGRGSVPHEPIRRSQKPQVFEVLGVGKLGRYIPWQPRRQILIEQELQPVLQAKGSPVRLTREPPLTFRGKEQASANIFMSQLRKVLQDVRLRHVASQV
jgi:hypothetical protein